MVMFSGESYIINIPDRAARNIEAAMDTCQPRVIIQTLAGEPCAFRFRADRIESFRPFWGEDKSDENPEG